MKLSKKSVRAFLYKIPSAFLSLLVFLFPLSSEIGNDDPKFLSHAFEVDFSRFSPAFAAFEDDFLFEQIFFNKQSNQKENEKNQKKITNQSFSNKGFDGEVKIKNLFNSTNSKIQKEKSGKITKILNAGELNFGFLANTLQDNPESNLKYENTDTDKEQEIKNNFSQKSVSKNPQTTPITIHGNLSLKEGLAFMGTMEVQWVLGKNILGFGSINLKEATYEIKVNQLIGDIIVSVYDKNKKLIGEGFFGMDQISKNSHQISKNINVFPINWDHAGQVFDARSLTSTKKKTLSGVNISLYGFDEQTKTDKGGEFSFHNWKKVNSRSIALASKPGYYDSLFIIDSKKPAIIPLLSESYMKSFFSYLRDQGLPDPKNKGTVYGSVLGTQDKSGYKVFIENKQPIYFLPAGFADIRATTTSNNGLFSFVGLETGDYRLFIEKDGKIVNQKWIAVEAGKVTTLCYKDEKTEPIGFYNTASNLPFEKSVPGFFDNDEDFKMKSQNNISGTSSHNSKGKIPNRFSSIHQKALPGEQNFIPFHENLKIPFFLHKKLYKLTKEQNMVSDHGLIFGFINSPEKYQVTILEKAPKKVIYFNEKAQIIDPNKEIAFGFIISGFQKGLNSLVIQTDEMILATNLVFSDHKTLSIVKMKVFPVDS